MPIHNEMQIDELIIVHTYNTSPGLCLRPMNLWTIEQTMMSFSAGTGGLACLALVDDKALVEV